MPQRDDLTLLSWCGPKGWLIPICILSALALQLLALTLPFIEMSVFLEGQTIYGLLTTVKLLWKGELYTIAILIVSFSVVFPFVKLTGLMIAWVGLRPSPARSKLIKVLGTLGKWSMMDPFCVILLVALSSGQWAVGATTCVGVYCFLGAIVIAMVLSIIMSIADRRQSPPNAPRDAPAFRVASKGGFEATLVPAALLVSLACIVLAFDVPLIQIDQFLLHSNAFGLADVCIQLYKSNQHPLSALAWIGLGFVPLGVIALEFWAWLAKSTPNGHIARRHFIDYVHEWGMIDVFGLSLVLYLLEGSRFIKTEVRNGLWVLVGAVIMTQISRRIAQHVVLRCVRQRSL